MIEGVRWRAGSTARVRVAASTSNLGPGFDLVGLGLGLWLDVRMTDSAARATPELERATGARGSWPEGPNNLLLRGFDLGCKLSRAESRAVHLSAATEIPLGRGLGSSGAAIVAGALLGASVGPETVERTRILEAAVALEGHPDNVAPALLGGCVLSVPVAGSPTRCIKLPVHRSLAFAVAWPAATLETRFARSILPAQVPFADAVENPRRLALLLEGLRSADPELLRLGGEDRLHVPHRLPHIPGGRRALDAAREAGAHLATISGSGSGLFAIAAPGAIARVAESMRAELERASPPACARVVESAMRAPVVELE